MVDPRVEKLANMLVNYSCAVQKGERALVEAIDVPHEFTNALVRSITSAGGLPLVMLKSNQVFREMMLGGTRDQWETIADIEMAQMQRVDCYIGARGNPNISQLSDVPAEKQKIYEQTVWKRVHHDVRIKRTKWVVLRWPNPSMAQMAEMSTEAFEDFYFNVCTLDYARMSGAMKPLVTAMQKTDRVHLKGPGDTDLTFSIKGIPAIPCDGRVNIPDGEVFTAPVRDSLNGIIQFNTPTIYRGTTHNDIRLVFREGRIVAATSSESAKLNEVLDADEGARFIGEFAIGFNPYCVKPMKDILFDEKIAGSIHLTPGACYDEASNGNKSDIHWDIVLRQTPEVGGGEIWFDDTLIRKNGQFLVDDLIGLNPENLT
jgi:aminopeptidase